MKNRSWLVVLLPGVAAAASVAAATADWNVSRSPSLLIPRAAHQATILGPTELLLTGGCSGAGCSPVESSAEIYDLETGRTTPTRPMRERRVAHVAARLPDGRVLVAGGWTGVATTSSAEVFDPRRGAFSPVGALATPRMDATATPLSDGSILVVGGASATNRPVARAEIFSAQDLAFRPAASLLEARAHHAALRLADGRVLVVGGLQARNVASRSAEIYDPRRNRFERTGSMLRPRCKHAAVLLEDGRVLVLGGSTDCDDRNRLAETELYDPRTGVFSPGPRLLNPRYKIVAAATVLPTGEVVVAGDAEDVEIWTPGDRDFAKAGGGVGGRLAFSAATALPNGEVLVTGGYDDEVRPRPDVWRIRR